MAVQPEHCRQLSRTTSKPVSPRYRRTSAFAAGKYGDMNATRRAPNARKAAATACDPTVTSTPPACSIRVLNASAPAIPPKKVTADMPITSESGPAVMTLVTASIVSSPISRAPAMKRSFPIALHLVLALRALDEDDVGPRLGVELAAADRHRPARLAAASPSDAARRLRERSHIPGDGLGTRLAGRPEPGASFHRCRERAGSGARDLKHRGRRVAATCLSADPKRSNLSHAVGERSFTSR